MNWFSLNFHWFSFHWFSLIFIWFSLIFIDFHWFLLILFSLILWIELIFSDFMNWFSMNWFSLFIFYEINNFSFLWKGIDLMGNVTLISPIPHIMGLKCFLHKFSTKIVLEQIDNNKSTFFGSFGKKTYWRSIFSARILRLLLSVGGIIWLHQYIPLMVGIISVWEFAWKINITHTTGWTPVTT